VNQPNRFLGVIAADSGDALSFLLGRDVLFQDQDLGDKDLLQQILFFHGGSPVIWLCGNASVEQARNLRLFSWQLDGRVANHELVTKCAVGN
jgi:hypothetical protein